MIRSWFVIVVLAVLAAGVIVAKTAFLPPTSSGAVPAGRAEAAPPAPAAKPTGPQPLAGPDLAAALSNGKPTLVDFGMGTCEQCKKQAPILAEAAGRYRGKANVVYVDVSVYAGLGAQYQVKLIPYQIFFDKDGKKVSDHVGLNPMKDIAAQLAKLGAK